MNKFSIFVSSSDRYSDLWPVFFKLFKRMWPEYDGKIYLQTENKTYSDPNLDIICTNIGRQKNFGAALLSGLSKVKEDNILFFMIDYIIMGKVNHEKVMDYYRHFCISNLDTLVLCCHNWEKTKPSIHPDFKGFLPPAHKILFSYQIAFWKKSVFMSVILPHENPWLSEWYGDIRCERMGLWAESLRRDLPMPIPYDLRGCLHQGLWLDNAVCFLNKQNIIVDYAKRGLYSEHEVYKTLRFRMKMKWLILKCGIMGSFGNLWKLRSIH